MPAPAAADDDYDEVVAFRHALHRTPELSGVEGETAAFIARVLGSRTNPTHLWTRVGRRSLPVSSISAHTALVQPPAVSHGVVAVYEGAEFVPGGEHPTVILRCELDALPITEKPRHSYISSRPGVMHACGHDGHMAILLGVALRIAADMPKRGRLLLLFQPAEETGAGAQWVANDPRLGAILAEENLWLFALHNVPNVSAAGSVLCRSGTFACASRGVVIQLLGSTSHAAHPEEGESPLEAMTHLLTWFRGLGNHAALKGPESGFVLSTVIHARLGNIAFGTSPGEGVVMATVRAERPETMDVIVKLIELELKALTGRHPALKINVNFEEVFPATVNDPAAVEHVFAAAAESGVKSETLATPFRWSEDFGIFSQPAAQRRLAMFALGSGPNRAQLHREDYDFPDDCLIPGIRVMERLVRRVLAPAIDLADTEMDYGGPAKLKEWLRALDLPDEAVARIVDTLGFTFGILVNMDEDQFIAAVNWMRQKDRRMLMIQLENVRRGERDPPRPGISCPRCNNRMQRHAPKKGFFWKCDGMDFEGGCLGGCTNSDQTVGWPRYRCASNCDVDFCFACFSAGPRKSRPADVLKAEIRPSAIDLQDMRLQCRNCHVEFIHDVASQQIFAERRHDVPSRCEDCRPTSKNRNTATTCRYCGVQVASKEIAAHSRRCRKEGRSTGTATGQSEAKDEVPVLTRDDAILCILRAHEDLSGGNRQKFLEVGVIGTLLEKRGQLAAIKKALYGKKRMGLSSWCRTAGEMQIQNKTGHFWRPDQD